MRRRWHGCGPARSRPPAGVGSSGRPACVLWKGGGGRRVPVGLPGRRRRIERDSLAPHADAMRRPRRLPLGLERARPRSRRVEDQGHGPAARASVLLVPLALALLAVWYTWPFAIAGRDQFPYNAGDTALIAAGLRLHWHELLTDPASLGDDRLFYPLRGTAFFQDLELSALLPFALLS